MPYELQLKPFTGTGGMKCKIIEITDIAFHTTKKTPTPSVGKKIQKAFNKLNKPDRIYSPIDRDTFSSDRKTFTLELLKRDHDFLRMIQKEESRGYKVLIQLPKDGIPMIAGDDTIEFLKSKNGKRLLRGFAKENIEK